MKNFVTLLLCLSLSVFAVARAMTPGHTLAAVAKTAQKKPTGQKADAKTLLDNGSKALAAMIKAARADKGLDSKTPKNKPFWKSTQLIAKNLKLAKKGLAAKSNDFFKGIAEARKAEEKELLAKIKTLEKTAQKDKALEKGLREIEKQANHILKEPARVDAYIATLYLLDVQTGLVRGYEYYVDKPWRTDYLTLVNWTNTYETSYYEWEASVSFEWASIDTSVDIYEGEDVDVSESVSDEEINTEESYSENESFDMSEAEEEEVAAEEDTDEEVASDDEDSMEDASGDEGYDMSDDDGRDNDGGDDDGGDDHGGDDGGADEGD